MNDGVSAVEYVILTLVLIVLIVIICLLFLMYFRQSKEINQLKFSSMSDNSNLSDELLKEFYKFQSNITTSLKDDLLNLNKSTNESLYNVTKNVHEGLNMGFEKTNVSFNEVSRHLVSINETQNQLNRLSKDIIELQNILTDKKTRGMFGEIELNSILKSAYGLNDEIYATQHRLSNGSIADAVIFQAKPLNKVVIDSKFPLENYLRMYDDNLTKEKQNKARMQFSRDVKKHIDDIKNKYIIKNETAEIAYLFIPAEAIFSEIYGRFSDVVHYSYECNVFLVSPTTLMAYISALKSIYLKIEQNEKVDEIQIEYGKLKVEFERFEKRYQEVAKDFSAVYRDMQKLDITADKIIKRFIEIEKVQLDGVEDEEYK